MVFAALSLAVVSSWARAALTVELVISALAMLAAPVQPRRTAGTDCRRGRHRTRGYTPVRTHACGNGGTTTESERGGCRLAGRLANRVLVYLSDLLPFMDVYDPSASCDL